MNHRLLLLLLITTPVLFGQTSGAPAATNHWVLVAAALSMAIASGLCGLAQSRAVASAAEGTARNPSAAPAIRFALLLGLALIESLALYAFVMGFVVIYR